MSHILVSGLPKELKFDLLRLVVQVEKKSAPLTLLRVDRHVGVTLGTNLLAPLSFFAFYRSFLDFFSRRGLAGAGTPSLSHYFL